MEGAPGLGLLNEIVSNANDEETYGQSRFNFADFEDDLDFINQHVDDEDVDTDEDSPDMNTGSKAESNAANNFDGGEYNLAQSHTGEVGRTWEAEDVFSPIAHVESNLEACKENNIGEILVCENTADTKKKVSFGLSDILEYSDDFESEDGRESISDKVQELDDLEDTSTVVKKSNIYSTCNCSNAFVNSSKINIGLENIKNCANFNCRMTSVRVIELPGLKSLFSKANRKSKLHKKGEAVPGKAPGKKGGKGKKKGKENNLKETAECAKNKSLSKENLILKNRDRMPVEHFWDTSSDESLLQWLKVKNKEARRKRAQEKKVKKEEKRIKKLEEIDKSCRKELSYKKFDEWMKKKQREERHSRRISRGKVSPSVNTSDINNDKRIPEGYTVLDTFIAKTKHTNEQRTEEGKTSKSKLSDMTREKPKKKNCSKNQIGQVPSGVKSCGEPGSDTKMRKTYNEWLKSKMISNSQITEEKEEPRSHAESNLLSKERLRRYEAKERSKQRVDSNLLKSSSASTDQGQAKGTGKCLVNNAGTLNFLERPDPQGCADPGNVKDKILASETLEGNGTAVAGESKDTSLLGFFTESKRPWMKNSDSHSQAKNAARPKSGKEIISKR